MTPRAFTRAVVAAVFAAVLPTGTATAYTISTLDFPGATFSENIGVNNAGQIVGATGGGDVGEGGAFRYDAGVFTPISIPGATFIHMGGISNTGAIVGTYGTADGGVHAYVLSGSTIQTIDVPGADMTFGRGINIHGDVVGNYELGGGSSRAFLLSNGVFTLLDVPGSHSSVAYGINDSGMVVGTAGNGAPFVFTYDGDFDTFRLPAPVVNSYAFGINNLGDIVGMYQLAEGATPFAYVYAGTTLTTLDLPGFAAAHGINDNGAVVGYYRTDQDHGFLATPAAVQVPEPSTPTLVLVGVSVLLVAVMRVRRRPTVLWLLLGLTLLGGCATPSARPLTWSRTTPGGDLSRDTYECERDTRVTFPFIKWQPGYSGPVGDAAPPSNLITDARALFGGPITREQLRPEAFYRQCLRARGWQESQ